MAGMIVLTVCALLLAAALGWKLYLLKQDVYRFADQLEKSLDGIISGKGKSTNGRRCGFCLESQFYPNSINCPNFPQPILRAGEQYHQVTSYQLGLL